MRLANRTNQATFREVTDLSGDFGTSLCQTARMCQMFLGRTIGNVPNWARLRQHGLRITRTGVAASSIQRRGAEELRDFYNRLNGCCFEDRRDCVSGSQEVRMSFTYSGIPFFVLTANEGQSGIGTMQMKCAVIQ